MESFNQIMMQELAETLSEPPCITPIVQNNNIFGKRSQQKIKQLFVDSFPEI